MDYSCFRPVFSTQTLYICLFFNCTFKFQFKFNSDFLFQQQSVTINIKFTGHLKKSWKEKDKTLP